MTDKILLISQVFYPDEVSTANLFTNLCSVLAGDGVDVEVWCAQPSYTNFEKQPQNVVLNGINIRFLPSTNFKKSLLIGRLVNYLSFTLSVSLRLLFSGEKTVVFTHTTPPTLGIVLSFICSLKNRKFVYVLLDIFPEGLVRLGKVSKKNTLIKLWQKLFIASLKRSNRIIVIGRDMMKWIGEIYSGALSKSEYIPLWQDDSLILPLEYSANDLVLEYNLLDKFVVQYSGNMGLWNEMGTLGKAVKCNVEGVTFMFVGGGMRKGELYNQFSSEIQKNVISLSFQPNNKLNKVLSACHIGLVSLRDGLEGMAVPSKIYGIMAAGIPIIALVPANSEIAYIVREENCGFVVNPTDLNGLINAVSVLKSDEKLRNEMGVNGRNAFVKKYTTKIIASKYKSFISAIN